MSSEADAHPFVTRELPPGQKAVILEGPERIHVSPQCDVKNGEYFVHTMYDDVRVAYDCFLKGEKVSNDGRCVGWRPSGHEPYRWLRYSEVRKMAQYFGSALLAKGFPPSTESKIGIFSQNRPEWTIVDLGCYSFSMATVPLYNTLGSTGLCHIINLVQMKLVVVDTIQKVNDLLAGISSLPTLKSIVVMEMPLPEDLRARAQRAGVEVVGFDAFMDMGECNLREPMPGKPEDLAVIRCTSGTTGNPKGAMITQANLVANAAGFASLLHSYSFPPGCTAISYLPLPHAYEHVLEMFYRIRGVAVGFFRGKIDELLLDVQELKPNVFPCVPRLANRIYDMSMGRMNSSPYVWRKAFTAAINQRRGDLEGGIVRKDTWIDENIFKKDRDDLGGNVQLFITGGAPISVEVKTYMAIVYGCPVVEGYGSTESTALMSLMVPGDPLGDNVGGPAPCNMLKLVDVPDMGYFAAQNQGEVCAKGPNVFAGYYKDPEKTAEALDEEGWLHSGDIGLWLPDGSLKLIDRKKHIYKLSQGEYIAPEKVENILMRSLLISQAFVYGDSLRSYNVAIFVPDSVILKKFAADNNLKGDIGQLCKNERVRAAIRADIDELSKAARLFGFERVAEFRLHPVLFSVENGLLTPSMKSKRSVIKDHFIAQIESMYAQRRDTRKILKQHKL